jgi:hypothetical protein
VLVVKRPAGHSRHWLVLIEPVWLPYELWGHYPEHWFGEVRPGVLENVPNGHPTHWVEEVSAVAPEYAPGGHCRQLVAAIRSPNSPGGQEISKDKPVCVEKVPCGHCPTQSLAEVMPTALENVPAGQLRQESVPGALEKRLAVQRLHCPTAISPVVSEKLPIGHTPAQAVCPTAFENLPAGHPKHAPPAMPEKRPATHAPQEVCAREAA